MKITHWGEDYATLKVGKKEFEVSIELGKAVEKQTIIKIYRKDVYGLEKIYVSDPVQANLLYKLTHRKTLQNSDIDALTDLGFGFEEVTKPKK